MNEAHPHDAVAVVPDRIPAADLRALSQISDARAWLAIATEWAIIATAIAIGSTTASWPLRVLAVLVIGARQHALTVLNHDATHYRLLRSRRWNEWVANLLLAWPMFISVQGFRHFHGDHHRFLGEPGDGNRELWHTHDAQGRLAPEWRYPKRWAALAWKIVRRAALVTGLFWIARGLVGGFLYGVPPLQRVARMMVLGLAIVLLTHGHAWLGFATWWVLPYCTWHAAAQYLRLVCEHSAIAASDPRYGTTRSTIPGALARFFVLPRNIGYHVEHHFYPSVPHYNLPALHERLMRQPGYAAGVQQTHSLIASLAQCVR
ncbi:MAG TPA: fatty acid desaturase family protein [Nannocystaceae bacterium]|nr:fatty acid desaturase family protein [Nannocystaceae bacterium]